MSLALCASRDFPRASWQEVCEVLFRRVFVKSASLWATVASSSWFRCRFRARFAVASDLLRFASFASFCARCRFRSLLAKLAFEEVPIFVVTSCCWLSISDLWSWVCPEVFSAKTLLFLPLVTCGRNGFRREFSTEPFVLQESARLQNLTQIAPTSKQYIPPLLKSTWNRKSSQRKVKKSKSKSKKSKKKHLQIPGVPR